MTKGGGWEAQFGGLIEFGLVHELTHHNEWDESTLATHEEQLTNFI